MKRTHLTFLPIAAALLLATSCSKDSDSEADVANNSTTMEPQNVETSAESTAIPFSIQVVTGGTLSKIGYDDDGTAVAPSFSYDDVTNELKMTISENGSDLGTLTLQDVDGNFSGNLETAPSEDGVSLTATITTAGDATYSTKSIIDLMEKCAHTYTGTFAYKSDTKVMLTDDKAYIEIFMSPLQHNIDVTIGSEKHNFTMSDDGKVWIAVAGGTMFATYFTGEKTTTAGKITTIKRVGFVDLGLSDGTLWADKNIGADARYDNGDYYAWGEIENKDEYSWTTYKYGTAMSALSKYCSKSSYGSSGFYDNLTSLENSDDISFQTNNKWSMPSKDDFAALKSSCYWVWTTDYSGKTGYIVYKVKNAEHKGKVKYVVTGDDYTSSYNTASDTHIFLPLTGYRWNTVLEKQDTYANYWSSSLYTDYPYKAYCLYFKQSEIQDQCNDSDRYYGHVVRAVRHK